MRDSGIDKTLLQRATILTVAENVIRSLACMRLSGLHNNYEPHLSVSV